MLSYNTLEFKTLAILLILAACDLASAQSAVYRCQGLNGSIVFSDKPCPTGDVREGNRWTSVQEVERRKAEEAERARREQDAILKREYAAAEARERQLRQKVDQEIEMRQTQRTESQEPTSDSIDRMTTYAVVLGRAIGCGIDTQHQTTRVGLWFDKNFPLGPSKSNYMKIMMNGIQQHATLQKNGQSPDSCSSIRQKFQSFPWP